MSKNVNILIQRIKAKTGLTQDEIGQRINIGHSQFSFHKKKNTEHVYDQLMDAFKNELGENQPDVNDLQTVENLLTLSASVKMLYEEVAVLKAKNEGTTKENSIKSMRMRTKTIISGLT